MKKRYTVDYDWKFECVFEIDDEVFTEQMAKSINEFWMNPDYRASQAGSHLHAVLKMLANHCWILSLEHANYIRAFDYELDNCGQEGWPKMDGSAGIKIIRVDNLDLDYDDMNIEVATA